MNTPADQPAEPIVPLDPDTPEGRQAAEELSDVLARAHLRIQGGSRPADLVAWLRQQLDDDERTARAASVDGARWRAVGEPWGGRVVDADGNTVVYDEGAPTEAEAEHIARHDPARVLAEVDAKRRLLDWLERRDDWAADNNLWTWDSGEAGALLALPYADREGFREEWRP